MARYYALAPLEGSPASLPTNRYVADTRVPDDHCHAFRTVLELLGSHDLMGLFADPDCKPGSMSVSEFEASGYPQDVIEPKKGEGLEGVWVKPLAEVARTPVLDWLKKVAAEGSAEEQEAAEMALIMAEVAGE